MEGLKGVMSKIISELGPQDGLEEVSEAKLKKMNAMLRNYTKLTNTELETVSIIIKSLYTIHELLENLSINLTDETGTNPMHKTDIRLKCEQILVMITQLEQHFKDYPNQKRLLKDLYFD